MAGRRVEMLSFLIHAGGHGCKGLGVRKGLKGLPVGAAAVVSERIVIVAWSREATGVSWRWRVALSAGGLERALLLLGCGG